MAYTSNRTLYTRLSGLIEHAQQENGPLISLIRAKPKVLHLEVNGRAYIYVMLLSYFRKGAGYVGYINVTVSL